MITTNWRKCFVIAALLALVSSGLATKPASAHSLDLDGNIAVVLHTNPNDMPSSGAPTSFILFFNDSSNQFSLPKCNCRATVLQGLQTIISEPLADTSSLQSNNPVTFPKAGVYTIEVNGSPKEGYTFQPFFVSYTVRVIRGSSSSKSIPVFVWIGLGIVIALVFGCAIVLRLRESKPSKGKD